MGDSFLSPPLAVKTPYNKTDLDEFRDSLGEELNFNLFLIEDELANISIAW